MYLMSATYTIREKGEILEIINRESDIDVKFKKN